MTRETRKRAARRAVDRHGQTVTLTTYTEDTGADEWSDNQWTSSTTSVTARVERRQTPRMTRDASGEEVDVDVTFYLKDSVSVSDIDAGDGRSSELSADGTSYKVVRVDNQDNGILAVDCIRK